MKPSPPSPLPLHPSTPSPGEGRHHTPESKSPPLPGRGTREDRERGPGGEGTWLLPYLVLLAHAFFFGGWIVDDAGITFVYARNLVAGHGLVSQPGLPPVEGFSNFLWMATFLPPLFLGVFHPVIVPKVASLILLAGSFFLLDRSLTSLNEGNRIVSVITLLLLAICTPFVVWTVSGLENPLYVFLLCLLLWLVVRERERAWSFVPWVAGVVAVGIALTRPDGILFAPLYPLLSRGGWRRRLIPYGLTFTALVSGFLFFRWSYFGEIVPNTFYAKGAPNAKVYLDLFTLPPKMTAKAVGLFESVAGEASALVLILLLAGTAFLVGRGRFAWQHGVLLTFAWFGAIPYLLLPFDWMPELRFATPLFPFFYAYAVTLGRSLLQTLFPEPGRRRLPAWIAAVLALSLSLALFAGRSISFAASPTVSFDETIAKFGLRYNRFADVLGLERASILLPDVGGTLWVSKLRVYDLVGLTDRTIAKTLDKHPERFYDYVFEEIKPTFIHTHHYWSLLAAFDQDPRFRRDYLPLFRYFVPAVRERAGGFPLSSGDFVRRDAVSGKEAAVAVLKAELAEHYRKRAERERWGAGIMGPAVEP